MLRLTRSTMIAPIATILMVIGVFAVAQAADVPVPATPPPSADPIAQQTAATQAVQANLDSTKAAEATLGSITTQAALTPPAPDTTPPATVGQKGHIEVRVGAGKMFWPADGTAVASSDVTAEGQVLYWVNDHTALGVSAYHDTLLLKSFAPQLPQSAHSVWGFDLICAYTLKTFSTGTLPEVPGAWVNYLNQHAKKVTVNAFGGIGAIHIEASALTATYFVGVETRYWFDTLWYASVIADLRKATYLGVNRTFPETKLLIGVRF